MRVNTLFHKYKKFIITSVIVIITISGYILYYGSKSSATKKNEEYLMAKGSLVELQKKQETINQEITQLKEVNEAFLQKQQECKSNLDSLQKQYNELLETNAKLKNDLLLLQPKTPSTEMTQPQATTQTPKEPAAD